MSDHPWFKFYVADYTIGTKLFSLEEDGAYIRCLCHQWDAGSVPGDDMKAMAALLRVSVPKAKAVWAVIAKKFVRGEDGGWRNQRMEKERQWLNDKVSAGRAGGLAKAKQTPSKEPSKPLAEGYQTASNEASKGLAKPYQSEVRSQNSDPESSAKNADDDARARGVVVVDSRPEPLIQNSLNFERKRRYCAFVGERLEVPKGVHRSFIGKGADAAALDGWYRELDAEIVASHELIPDWPVWLWERFKTWAEQQAGDAVLQAWLRSKRQQAH